MYVHPESRKKYCFANIEELESWAKELSFSSCILEQVEDIPKPLLCIKEWLSHNHTMVNEGIHDSGFSKSRKGALR
jgi:hypothetical protein